MAEILLAKVLGPGGFERPVVLKRVLPHMAAEREFRDMFLDEARIVASIHHPNVVQVHELGREDDELYLVMEYLAGESARSLCARASARGARLDFGLCAHIVAEACGGLHAAHEFTGPDGKLLQVVHRDVCPNNLIVTYEGSVKVVDFGIAFSADRFTMTSAGQVKGKAAYMAPEQCLGKPIDRRTDVFALGVVLYELSTGHRLFADALESRVVASLYDRGVPPPSSIVKKYPAELERICMRALSYAPSARFASAEEMRRELVRFQRERATDLLPEERLRACMHDLFEDRIAEKADMLRQLRAGSGVFNIPSAEISDELAPPLVKPEPNVPDLSASVVLEPESHTDTRGPTRRRRRVRGRTGLWGAAALVGACLATAALLFVAEPAGSARHALYARVASTLLGFARTAAEAPKRVLGPTTVPVEAHQRPSDADVSLADAPRGVTPWLLAPPHARDSSSLRFELPGREQEEQTFSRELHEPPSLVLTQPMTSRLPLRSAHIAGPSDRADAVPDVSSPSSAQARAPDADLATVQPPQGIPTSEDAESAPTRELSSASAASPTQVAAQTQDDKGARRKPVDKHADMKDDDFFLFD